MCKLRVSIFWTFDHLLADAYAFVKFLSAWCEIATTKKLSTVFNHDKQVLRPRLFPAYSQVIDQMYVVREKKDYHETLPSNRATKKHLYFVKGSTLEILREASSEDGARRSRTVALSAYLWKLMANTVNEFEHTKCNLAMIIEGRRWINGGSESMSNYIGNVLSLATGEESTTKLKEVSLAYIARVISREINKVANKEHFLDLIDWVECH